MRTFEEKTQCENFVGHPLDMCVVQSDLACKAGSCPSRRYWKKHNQIEWHDARRVLREAGLEKEYDEEMV